MPTVTDRPIVHSPLPGPPSENRGAPTVVRPTPSTVDTAEPAAVALPLVAAVARGVALVVVLPVRLLWELIAAAGRLVYRSLLSPVGRFLHRWLLSPLSWALHRLLWVPLVWCARNLLWLPLRWVALTLVWLPLVWLGRGLAWAARTLIWQPLVWLAYGIAWFAGTLVWAPLVWLVERLVLPPLRWLGAALAPVGRLLWRGVGVLAGAVRAALVGLVRGIWWVVVGFGRLVVTAVVCAWRAAGRVLRLLHRLLLLPLGRGLRWVWRHTVLPLVRGVQWVWSVTVVPVAHGLGVAWRATVVPAARWTRRAVLDPARLAYREVLSALGLRR